MRIKHFFCFLVIVLFFSCIKKQAQLPQTTPTSFSQIFDRFWTEMNTNYQYWDLDTIDWDRTYKTYKPVFDKLDLSKDEDVIQSVDYFRDMTYNIFDAHYSITFNYPVLQNTVFYPASERKQRAIDYHYPFDYLNIDSFYFNSGFNCVFDSTNSINGQPLNVIVAYINDNILYFRCNQFSLSNSFLSPYNNSVKPVLESFFDTLHNLPASIHGIIIDLRNNAGGYSGDLDFFLGKFLDKPLKIGYSRYKTGEGRFDYTPWIEAYVHPQQNSSNVTKRIIALTDSYSVSLAETIAIGIHTMPNGQIVGEKTWGATGPLAPTGVYNSGGFVIPGFLTVETSSAAFKYINDSIYENKGFPPDIESPFNLVSLENGSDPQLEKAIKQIE